MSDLCITKMHTTSHICFLASSKRMQHKSQSVVNRTYQTRTRFAMFIVRAGEFKDKPMDTGHHWSNATKFEGTVCTHIFLDTTLFPNDCCNQYLSISSAPYSWIPCLIHMLNASACGINIFGLLSLRNISELSKSYKYTFVPKISDSLEPELHLTLHSLLTTPSVSEYKMF